MSTRQSTSRRRGVAIAMVVVMLAMLHLMVIGGVSAAGDEARIGSLRVETSRAFYLAEAGSVITIKTLSDGLTPPEQGTELALPGGEVAFVTVPETPTGEVVVEGRSGFGKRRVSITLE